MDWTDFTIRTVLVLTAAAILWYSVKALLAVAAAMVAMMQEAVGFDPDSAWGWFCKITVYAICGPVWALATILTIATPLINMYCAASTARDWWHSGDKK